MNWMIAFWVVIFVLIALLVAVVVMAVIQIFTVPQVLQGQFRLLDVSVNHLNKTQVDVLFHIALSPGVDVGKIPTQADMSQAIAAEFGAPTFAATDPWEKVAEALTLRVWKLFDLMGISTQIFVYDNVNDKDTSSVQTATYTRGAADTLRFFQSVH